ncbi:Ig-like domain-containing protein [Crocosphaera sp. Alani8]|uniref:Ig-like domain-containing protein n=1 Tax=Crocosphaera sp. Alani8 TaxID=3038952 RepID=UPI00313D62A3
MLQQQLSIETPQDNLGVGEVFILNIFHEVFREETDPNARELTVRVFYNDLELQLDNITYPDPRFTEQFTIPTPDGNNDDGIDETNARQAIVFNGIPVTPDPNNTGFPEERTLVLQLTFTTLADFDGTQLSALIPAFEDSLETISVNLAVNESPIANDDEYSVDEDDTLTIPADGVLDNDTDVDGDALTSVLLESTSNGSLTLNDDGSFEYIPNADFNGTDSFTYEVNDGELDSEPATVTITVNPTNDDPVANDDEYSVSEDNTLNIAADGVLENDTDIDEDFLTVVENTQPDNGTLNINPDGSFEYTPNTGFSGEDSFEYTISDGNEGNSTATVTITVVEGEDNPPVANDDEYSVDEDDTLTIPADGVLDNDTDVDGDALTSVLLESTSNGSLTLNDDGSFEYIPNADFNGTDSFTYEVNDGELDSEPATVTITVNPTNDDPVANDDEYSVSEDNTLNIAADGVLENDTDIDEDFLTVVENTQPDNGTLNINPDGSFEYTPNTGFSGEDSFEYTISDGNEGNSTATVTITVVEGEDNPPVANDDEYSVDEDDTLTIPADGVLDNDTDVDGDALTSVLLESTSNGSLTLNDDGSFEYIPNADFNGTDNFTYVVNDGELNSEPATVTITVNPVNDAPVASDDRYNVNEDETLTVQVRNGVNLSVTNGSIIPTTVTPGGEVEVSWEVTNLGTETASGLFDSWIDGFYLSEDDVLDDADIFIGDQFISLPEIPLAGGESYNLTSNLILPDNVGGNFLLVFTDEFNNQLETNEDDNVFAIPIEGNIPDVNLSVTNGSITPTTLTPGGEVEVSWEVTNLGTETASGLFDSWIDGFYLSEDDVLDDADIFIGDQFISLPEIPLAGGESYNLTSNLILPDNIGGSFLLVSTDEFNDQIETNEDDNVFAIPIEVNPFPVVVVGTISANNGTVIGDLSVSDVNNPLRPGSFSDDYELINLNSGVVTISLDSPEFDTYLQLLDADTGNIIDFNDDFDGLNSQLTLMPEEGINYIVRVTSFGSEEIGEYTLNAEFQADGLLANDTDIDGDALTPVLITGPSNGDLTLNEDGSFEYVPGADFNGTDSFTYVVNDGQLDSEPATITITVNPLDDEPVATDDLYTINQDETLTVVIDGVLGNDIDVDGDGLSVIGNTEPNNGTLTINPDGSFSYIPDAGFTGEDSFEYTISDGNEGNSTATVTITVLEGEDNPPVANDDEYSVDEDDTLTIPADGVLGNDIDVDGDGLSVIGNTEPNNGTLTINPDGSFSYIPDAGFTGEDSFEYTISDGNEGTSTAFARILVNSLPVATEPPVFGTLEGETLDAGVTPGFDGRDDLVFGGAGIDVIDSFAGNGGNRLYGQSGDDTFIVGSNERVFGNAGDDRFFLLGGNNAVTGGVGLDQFWIANAEIPESSNTITDFDLEDDLLNIEGLGVGSFNDLTLSNENGNAVIAFGDDELAKLLRVNADSLSADNFGILS